MGLVNFTLKRWNNCCKQLLNGEVEEVIIQLREINKRYSRFKPAGLAQIWILKNVKNSFGICEVYIYHDYITRSTTVSSKRYATCDLKNGVVPFEFDSSVDVKIWKRN